MLGLLVLGLTSLMIYTLVKNALLGRQLNREDKFNGRIDLIIPVTPHSEFFIDGWINSVSSFHLLPEQLKIHLLIDGHHPSLNAWLHMKEKIPFMQIHCFTMKPNHVEAVPWMLAQIAPQITSEIVIIGDAELVPSNEAFLSIGRNVTEKGRAYFVLPQTAKFNLTGEAIASLNPTLAFASIFGLKKWRQLPTNALMSVAQGWLAMDLKTFKTIDFGLIRLSSWKEAIARLWEEKNQKFYLAFGEKYLLRHYPFDLQGHLLHLKDQWKVLWTKKDKKGFWFFIIALFTWSFPIICFYSHPFWALASIFLLVIYRFFTKIVFQESWFSIILHPLASICWIVSFIWWGWDNLRSRGRPQVDL